MSARARATRPSLGSSVKKNTLLSASRPTLGVQGTLGVQNSLGTSASAGVVSGQNNGGVLGGIGYLGHKLGLGVLSTLEGIWDYSAGGIAKLFGADEWAEEQFKDDWVNYNSADEWYDPSEGWKFAGDVASGIGTSAVSIGAAFIPVVGPAVSIAVAGLGAAGNATKEAYRQTGKLGGKEFAYGALVGGTEAVLEAVTGKIGAGSQRIATEIAEKMGRSTAKEVTKTVAKKSAKQIAGQLAKDFAGEAFEEGMAEILSPFFKNVTYSEGEKIDWKSVGYNALVGGISGVVMGGSQQAVNTTKNYFSGKSAVKNGTADGILREAKNIWEIERGADASLGTAGGDAERGTGIAAFEAVKSTYEKLQESLKATGGELKTANQMMMLGSLKEQNVAARLSIFVEKSAKRLVENADSFAARSVEFGMKDADGNPVSIDAAKITEGVDRSDLNSKAGYKRYIKSLRRAMVNNATLGQLAVADATGHLLLDTQKFAAAEQRALKMADATDLNRFLERADEKEKAALAERLGVEDFNMLSHESFRAAVAEMAEDGDVMRDFAKQNARVKRAVSAENTAVLPETVTSDLADGVYRADVQGNGLSVLKEGKNFFVVEPTTRKISRALGLEELTSTLRGVRSEVAAEGRLAIGRTVENKPFVEIENDILDGVPESDWIKTVKSNLAAKFPNGIKLGKNTVKINLTTRREMTFSKYMQWLKANDPQAFSDKLRATDNVDEILQATTGWINEGLNHPRSDSVTDFARGTVLIKVGQHDYSADVVVGSAQDGSMLMYDIINLQPTTITKKETSSVITGDPSREASRKALHLSDTSITENAEKSNSFAEKNSANDANSDTSVNLEGERLEQAPALQRNAQTESEQTAEDNGKARREAIAIDVWARENIPDYAGLNAPARAAVRATVRSARAHGVAESDVKTYARVAARSGLNISFDVAQAAGGDARYDMRNTVYVSPSAPAERIQRGLLLHEGGHALFFKTKSGKKLLARAVEMADAETATEVRKQYTEYYKGQELSEAQLEEIIREEIASAGLEKALGVDGAWEFILAEQPTLGERFLSFFRGAARDYAGVGELSAEARKLLRTYQKAFAELAAYNQGNNALTGMNGEKTQVSETKKAADGAERFALSGQKTPTYEELVAKSPIKIVDVKKGIESDSYANMKSAVSEKAKQEGWFDAPHHNKDTDGLIFLTEKSFTHAYSNLSTAFGEDTIRCMAHIPEIINEAVLVSVDDPRDNRKSETKVYTFFGAIDGVGGLEPVKLTVKEYGFRTIKDVPKNIRAYFEKNGVMESYNSLYDTHALEVIGVEGIKKESDASGKVGAQGARARATSDSTISIANLLDLVKGDAEKYIPKASTNFRTDGDLQGRLALPKNTKFQASAKTDANAATRKSGDVVMLSKGEKAKLHANYAGDKVFDKKSVKDALSGIEAFQKLPAEIRNEFVNSIWTGYNRRLHSQGFELFTDIMWDQLHATVLQENGFEMTEDEIRVMDEQIVEALNRIVASGKPSIKAKLESATSTEGYRKQANYWREEHSRVVERNKLLGRVKFEVEKLANAKAGRYLNAAQYRGDSFRVAITELAKMNWRGGLVRDTKIREHFAALDAWYSKDNPLYKGDGGGNELFRQDIKDALGALGNAQNGALTTDDLLAAESVIKYFAHEIEAHNTVYKNGKRQDAMPLAKEYVAKIGRAAEISGRGLFTRSSFARLTADPALLMRQADGYLSGFFTEQFEELRRGTIDAAVTERELAEEFEKFWSEHEQYGKRYNNATVTFDGKEMPLQEAISLYMTMKREHAFAGLAGAGFEIEGKRATQSISEGFADEVEKIKAEEYKKLPPEELLTLTKEGNARIEQAALKKAIEHKSAALEKQFTAEDKALIAVMERGLEAAREIKVRIDEIIQGYSNVTGGYYFPIRRTGLAENVDAFTGFEGDRVSNLSINKDTVKNAHKLLIEPVHVVYMRHLKAISLYEGLGVFTDNFNRLFNLNINDNANNPLTVRTELSRSNNYTKEMLTYFKEMKQDVEGISKKRATERFYNDAVAYIRSAYATYQLGFNPKVWVTQLSSFVAATNMLDADCLARGLSVNGADVDEYCRLAWLRNNDNAAAMAQAVSTPQNAVQRAGRGVLQKIRGASTWMIGKMDRLVVRKLFAACQVQVEKNGGAKVGTKENKVAAGEMLTRVILETQQNSLMTERSAAMRSGDELLKGSTMFSADAMKITARAVETDGKLRALRHFYKEAKKAGREADAAALQKQIKTAKKQQARAMSAFVGVALFNAALAYAFKWLYRRDEEEDAGTFLADTFGNMLGGIPFVRDAWGLFYDGYEADHFLYATFNDVLGTVSASYALLQKAADGEEITRQQTLAHMRKILYAVGQLTGVPVRNIYNVSTGMINRVSPETGYEVESLFYQKNYRTDLQKALEAEDEERAAFLLGLVLEEETQGEIPQRVREEMLALLQENYGVLPRATPKSYTKNAETFTLDKKQQEQIAASYAEIPAALDKLFGSAGYQQLSPEQRAEAIGYLYDLYRAEALTSATGEEFRTARERVAGIVGQNTYVMYCVATKGITSDVDKNGETVAGSKRRKVVAAISGLGVPVEQRLLLICASGYALKDGDVRGLTAAAAKKRLLRYILSHRGMSAAEKAEIAEMCGFEVKNGRIRASSVK